MATARAGAAPWALALALFALLALALGAIDGTDDAHGDHTTSHYPPSVVPSAAGADHTTSHYPPSVVPSADVDIGMYTGSGGTQQNPSSSGEPGCCCLYTKIVGNNTYAHAAPPPYPILGESGCVAMGAHCTHCLPHQSFCTCGVIWLPYTYCRIVGCPANYTTKV